LSALQDIALHCQPFLTLPCLVHPAGPYPALPTLSYFALSFPHCRTLPCLSNPSLVFPNLSVLQDHALGNKKETIFVKYFDDAIFVAYLFWRKTSYSFKKFIFYTKILAKQKK
jgi:hypothetical protein